MEHVFDDGSKWYPFGESVHGLLVYSPQGYMSGMLMRNDRHSFHARSLFGGSLEERASAMEGFIAYSGRYEVLDTYVVHHVEVSLFPNWVGHRQQRFFKIEGDVLTLHTNSFVDQGRKQIAYLRWQRIVG